MSNHAREDKGPPGRIEVATVSAPPASRATHMRKTVFLLPSFGPYVVPILDSLYDHLGRALMVIALRYQRQEASKVALTLGRFPRKILPGYAVPISRGHDRGCQSPFGFIIAPTMPGVLAYSRPDIVVSANFNVWTLTALLMGFTTIVYWEGTHHTERTVQRWRQTLRRWMARRASAFVVNGKLSRRYVESLGVSPTAVVEGGLCAAPVPAEHAVQTPRRLVQGEPIRFLFVGRLIEGKGIDCLLRAAAVLRNCQPGTSAFEVVIVGDGPDRVRFEHTAHDLHLRDLVRFVGSVGYRDVWSWYANSHVFVLPTLQDNWPLVVPEAMAMGMPILLSNRAGSVPDLLREGSNGWSFDPDRPEQLAALCAEYLRRPSLIESHGRTSMDVVRPYTPRHAADAFLKALNIVQRVGPGERDHTTA